ncbi:MAG: hypothetical protein AAF355_06085 [Myxococcota bacterium]
MGYEKTEPKNNLILFFSVLSLVTLAALAFGFESYFKIEADKQYDLAINRGLPLGETPFSSAAQNRVSIQLRDPGLVDPWQARREMEREHLSQLTSDPMPISRAMHQLAERGRSSAPIVEPRSGNDLGAAQGWERLPLSVTGTLSSSADSVNDSTAIDTAAKRNEVDDTEETTLGSMARPRNERAAPAGP